MAFHPETGKTAHVMKPGHGESWKVPEHRRALCKYKLEMIAVPIAIHQETYVKVTLRLLGNIFLTFFSLVT